MLIDATHLAAADAHAESTRLPPSTLAYSVTSEPFCPNPLTPKATRHFRFCVPDEWYRRSKSRTASHASYEPSQATIRRLASLQESEDENEDEEDESGTAKISDGASTAKGSGGADNKGTFSANRLSTIFGGWLGESATSTSAAGNRSSAIHIGSPEKRKSIVSEPKLVAHLTGGTPATKDAPESATDASDDYSEKEFDAMLVSAPLYFDGSLHIYVRTTWA